MGRINRLSPAKVRSAKPGLHADGGGLYLQVRPGVDGLRRSWVFRYAAGGHERYCGLGALHTISLAEAREFAREARQLRLAGLDPIEQKKTQRATAALGAVKTRTFDEVRDDYFREHRAKWRNPVHARDWLSAMQRYVSPVFGKVAVKDVNLELVIRALEPHWASRTETMRRVASRIAVVLDFAQVSGLRSGDNPARWDLLSKRFASRAQLAPVKHHPALPWQDVPGFTSKLRERPEPSARAVEFLILTAGRSAEVLGARWDEVKFEERVWAIPGPRMKSGKEHRIPMSDAALAVLKRQHEIRQSDYVFPGTSRASVSNNACALLLRRMGHGDVTLHGFRSSFRDWVAERTSFESEVAEAALAHRIPDRTRAAYERGDKFEKRRRLMDAWAAFCSMAGSAGEVVQYPGRRS